MVILDLNLQLRVCEAGVGVRIPVKAEAGVRVPVKVEASGKVPVKVETTPGGRNAQEVDSE